MLPKTVSECLWLALRIAPVAVTVLALYEIDRLGKKNQELLAVYQVTELANAYITKLETRIENLELEASRT